MALKELRKNLRSLTNYEIVFSKSLLLLQYATYWRIFKSFVHEQLIEKGNILENWFRKWKNQ